MIKNMIVYKDAMLGNLERTKGLIFSQQILLALVNKGCSRQLAYSLTQKVSMEAWKDKQDFKTLLLKDHDINEYLKGDEIEQIFSLSYHLKYVEEIFGRVFKDEI